MTRVLQNDYPRKSHLVAERIDESTVKTECGRTFEQPNGGAISTFELEADTYDAPVEQAQCGNCPWGDV